MNEGYFLSFKHHLSNTTNGSRIIKTFKEYYTHHSFSSLNTSMKKNKDLRPHSEGRTLKSFQYSRCNKNYMDLMEWNFWETMKDVWKKLCPFFFIEVQDSEARIKVSPINQATEEVIAMAMAMALDLESNSDIFKFLNSHDQKFYLII